MTFARLLFMALSLRVLADHGGNVDLSTIADTVAGSPLLDDPTCFGAGCLFSIVTWAYGWLQPIFAVVAAFLLVWYGFMLVNSQEEEKLQKAKRMVGASIAALMILYFPFHFITAFYGTGAGAGQAIHNPLGSAAIVATEIAGIVLWLETIVAVLAVTSIIVSGILAVTSYGKEEGRMQFKHTVSAVLFGIVLIALKQVILLTFGLQAGPALPGPPTMVFALVRIVQLVNALLGFAGFLAAAVIIYAGITMALNFGNDEEYSRAKGIILRAVIGLFAIMASLAVIRFVLTIA